MLTLQMVRLMDKLWLNEGLDLKMVVFSCVPTGKKRGMIEMVTKAETLRKIQVEHGLTGSFKDKPIAEWLAKHNPTELEYERAVENFTGSFRSGLSPPDIPNPIFCSVLRRLLCRDLHPGNLRSTQ